MMTQSETMRKAKDLFQQLREQVLMPALRKARVACSYIYRSFSENLFSSRHLDRSILLEETGSPAMFKLTIYAFFIFLVVFCIWACFMKIDEVSIAPGEIIPQGKTHKIQHLEGGILASILVHDGDEVQKDQLLVTIDQSKVTSQLNEALHHQKALSARIQRLEAFLKSREMEAPKSGSSETPTAQDDQIGILAKSFESLAASRKVIQQQIGQLEDEISGLEITLANSSIQHEKMQRELQRSKEDSEKAAEMLKKEKALMQEEIDIREELVDQGLNSNIKFLILQREFYQLEKEQLEKMDSYKTKIHQFEVQLAELEMQKKGLPLEISKRNKRILELQSTLVEKESSILEKSHIQLDELREQLAQADESVVRHADSVAKAQMKSPTRGYVHGMKFFSTGSVVAAGEVIMEIVPEDVQLMAEIRITNLDIGHVKIGQDVVLKLTTYDFSRYGSVHGKLVDISPTSYYAEKEEPYYRGTVSLEQKFLDPDEQKHRLLPGMTLRGEVITGEKSIMSYLIKPIYKNTKQALKER